MFLTVFFYGSLSQILFPSNLRCALHLNYHIMALFYILLTTFGPLKFNYVITFWPRGLPCNKHAETHNSVDFAVFCWSRGIQSLFLFLLQLFCILNLIYLLKMAQK